MESKKLAVQLFTVRDFLNDPEQTAETFRRIAAMGYQGVEAIGFLNWDLDRWPELLAQSGLKCLGVHEMFETLEENLECKIRQARALGCDYLISAVPVKVNFEDIEQVRELCDRLNHVGRICRGEGLRLLYHNHTMEFLHAGAGNAMDILCNLTNPEYVDFEPCVYTMQISGTDPLQWIRRMNGRMHTIHIKDGTVHAVEGELLPMPVSTEPGRGNMDLRAMCKAAQASGAEWYVMEIHENCIHGDPFESLKICADYFTSL